MSVGVLATVCSLLTLGASPALADSCPNAQFRSGYSAYLPDCRAYEQVSPQGAVPQVNTANTGPALGDPTAARAAISGGAIAWETYSPIPGASSDGLFYLSRRTASGWSTAGVIPRQSTLESQYFCDPSMVWSSDLSQGVLSDGLQVPDGACPSDDPQLVAGEPQGVENLFIRSATSSGYQLASLNPVTGPPANAQFGAASSDFSHVVFNESAQLTSNAPSGSDLYEWADGVLALVSVLPDGTPVAGTLANVSLGGDAFTFTTATFTHAVSRDGSRVFFYANGALYVRLNPMAPQSPISGGVCTNASDACTVQVDASHAGGSGGGGQFTWASSDGSVVYFVDDASAGLTGDTVAGSAQNPYRYDVDTGALTDLTPTGGADVQGVSAASADGSYVYFVASGALANGALADEPNLYVYHDGAISLIATLSSSDQSDWQAYGNSGHVTARVSPSGRFLVFDSVASLTGYDNSDANTGQADGEVYLYDAVAAKLTCVSCNPSGVRPVGPGWVTLTSQPGFADLVAYYQSRNVLDDGRVFFNSEDALLARAANGQSNVYEFEPDGVGSCAQSSGCLFMLSSGSSGANSFFYDASANGDDAFVITDQELLGSGSDTTPTLYDARVDGGFPASVTPVIECSSSATCQGSPGRVPAMPTVGTVAFSGSGNATSGATRARVRVLSKVVHGARFLVRVRVRGRGRITIFGTGIKTVARWLAKAGTYKLRVTLTAREKKLLARGHTLSLMLRVRYAPSGGAASTATVRLTVKPALRHAKRHARRATTSNLGGA